MADFTPEIERANLQGYTGQGAFRFWCQMALPIVYDDSLSYYELLNKVVVYLNNTISDVATAETNIENINDTVEHNMDALLTAYNLLQGYVNDYFDNLDVQEEINNKLDEMATSGALSNLLAPLIPDLVTNWLNTNVNPVGSAVVVDNSLTVSGAAADAKKTGQGITGAFDLITGGVGTFNITGTGGFNSKLCVSAGKTYFFRYKPNTTIISGAFYVEGDSTTLLNLPANGEYKAFTPAISGAMRFYNGTSNTGTMEIEMLDIVDAESCLKSGLLQLISASSITDAGITDFSQLPIQTICFANYQQCYNSNVGGIPWTDGSGVILSLTWKNPADYNATTNLYTQFAFKYVSSLFPSAQLAFRRRNNNGTFSEWHYFTETGKSFLANPSNFIETINIACESNGSTVQLQAGTYNLFDSTHNDSYWANLAQGNPSHPYVGLILKNDVKLVGLGNVVFNATYSGDNTTIINEFSIFNIAGSCELNNIKMVGNGIEYLIHDDSNIVNVTGAYKFTVRDCEFVHQGNENESGDGAPVCIGGGSSTGKRAVIENCSFSSVSDNRSIIYHTTANAKSKMRINNCVFPNVNNTISLRNYTTGSTPDLIVTISNCYLGAQIQQGTMTGITLYEYNNVIHN